MSSTKRSLQQCSVCSRTFDWPPAPLSSFLNIQEGVPVLIVDPLVASDEMPVIPIASLSNVEPEPVQPVSARKGQSKRKAHSMASKANVVDAIDQAKADGIQNPLSYISNQFKYPMSLVSRWYRTRELIRASLTPQGKSDRRNGFEGKRANSKKYRLPRKRQAKFHAEEQQLLREYRERRERGLRVTGRVVSCEFSMAFGVRSTQ
eukprot:c20628_g1_i3.p1 GENE.c20628_g1_i3~~c20628_g1_i3.p1  ORF type:complete len:205 (-),score=19.00 c20628_g1_i3:2321-2935(-)